MWRSAPLNLLCITGARLPLNLTVAGRSSSAGCDDRRCLSAPCAPLSAVSLGASSPPRARDFSPSHILVALRGVLEGLRPGRINPGYSFTAVISSALLCVVPAPAAAVEASPARQEFFPRVEWKRRRPGRPTDSSALVGDFKQ